MRIVIVLVLACLVVWSLGEILGSSETGSTATVAPLSAEEATAASAAFREQLRGHLAGVEETVALIGTAAQARNALDQYDAFRKGYELLQEAQRSIPRVPAGAAAEDRDLHTRYETAVQEVRWGVRDARNGVEKREIRRLAEARELILSGRVRLALVSAELGQK